MVQETTKEERNSMIADKTIDEKTAKYWCAFADRKIKNALDEVLKNVSDKKNQVDAKKAIVKSINVKRSINEGLMNFLSSISPIDPTGGSVGIVSDLADKSPEQIKANAIAMASAAGIAATALTPAGREATVTIGKQALKHPGKAALVAAAGKLSMDLAGDKDDDWMTKLGKLVNKVWDIGKFTVEHGKEIAIVGTVAYSLFKTAPIWMPVLSSVIKAILRGNSLAIVEFDSNGTWYKMHYDIKYKRWELISKGALAKDPTPEEVEQLMNTKFFKKFLSQCKRYIDAIVNDKNREAVLKAISKLSDDKTKNLLNDILTDKDVISNMFALKFKY